MRVRITQETDVCEECHCDRVVVVDVSSHGYMAGAEIDHAVTCPTRLCQHGKRVSGPIEFQDGCHECDAESMACDE